MKKAAVWLDNFWYHYKWHTIIAAFFVAVGVICTVQLVSRQSYDAYIMYAGGGVVFGEDEQAVKRALEYVCDDYDGDGEKNLCLTVITVLSDTELEEKQDEAASDGDKIGYNTADRATALKNFDLEMMTGNSYLCIMSKYMYSRCDGQGRFVPLSDIFDEVPQSADDEYGIRLADTEFGRYFSAAFASMGEDCVVCLRRQSLSDAQSERSPEEYEKYAQILRNIASFRLKGE